MDAMCAAWRSSGGTVWLDLTSTVSLTRSSAIDGRLNQFVTHVMAWEHLPKVWVKSGTRIASEEGGER
tara:strand:+ start:313 stop:516 length:204 start_codon:yes stop_codon:yes gene_type:complete